MQIYLESSLGGDTYWAKGSRAYVWRPHGEATGAGDNHTAVEIRWSDNLTPKIQWREGIKESAVPQDILRACPSLPNEGVDEYALSAPFPWHFDFSRVPFQEFAIICLGSRFNCIHCVTAVTLSFQPPPPPPLTRAIDLDAPAVVEKVRTA